METILFCLKNTRTGRPVSLTGCWFKADAKVMRDQYNETSKDTFCVTRTGVNLKSSKPHSRPRSK